jgi:2-C-methyl-D-erythritol 4-phosphate cytidylyltransferase
MQQGREYSDDASVCEAAGVSVRVVEGKRTNIKVTTADDLAMVRRYLTEAQPPGGE